jgi:hypothetical protein
MPGRIHPTTITGVFGTGAVRGVTEIVDRIAVHEFP